MANPSMELLKGTLEVLILKTLRAKPMHGYAISRWIRDVTGDDFRIEEGALYPALRRLEKKGLVESRWGRTDTGREAKFYRLTEAGGLELESEMRTWHRYVRAMGKVLDAPVGAA